MITVKRKVDVKLVSRNRKTIVPATEPRPERQGKIPRISRLMALAIQFEEMLQTGEVTDATELASLYNVTQPRMSQIRALTLLAPDLQETLLTLPRETTGRSQIHEKCLRPICAEVDFARQREMWKLIAPSWTSELLS